MIYFAAATFVAFLLVVNVQKYIGEGYPIPVRMVALLVVVPAYLVNVAFNLTAATVFFLDPPRELATTNRLKRYIFSDVSWRSSVALFVCKYVLEPWDWNHCGLQRNDFKLPDKSD